MSGRTTKKEEKLGPEERARIAEAARHGWAEKGTKLEPRGETRVRHPGSA